VVRADDPGAREAAAIWFDGYVRGDLKAMVGQSLLPFRSTAGVAAKTPGDLKNLLASLLDESPTPRKVRGLQLYSPAGARNLLGVCPDGFRTTPAPSSPVAQVNGDLRAGAGESRKNAGRRGIGEALSSGPPPRVRAREVGRGGGTQEICGARDLHRRRSLGASAPSDLPTPRTAREEGELTRAS
jgi:hypothetical protein